MTEISAVDAALVSLDCCGRDLAALTTALDAALEALRREARPDE